MYDGYGSRLTTASAKARDAYVDGVDRLLAADGGVTAAFVGAIDADDAFALAYAGAARSYQMAGDAREATSFIQQAMDKSRGVTERERRHLEIFHRLIVGGTTDPYRMVQAHVADYPRDALIAQICMGVFGLIGFSGLPGREAEQLAFSSALAPHYGDDPWFLAQHAFAQAEAGQLQAAEATIERSIAGNPRNAYTAHVRAHIHYENGETDAGYGYLSDWRQDYDQRGLLHCHVSWHLALWALERQQLAAMWELIDHDIAPDAAWGPPLNVLTDMAAILYRAELSGVEVPPARWLAVSDYAMRYFPDPGVAFADFHTALAHAMAGQREALSRIAANPAGPAADLVGQMAESFTAIAEERWLDATRPLATVMRDHARLGGSRAQRDLIEYAMANVLLRQGRAKEARLLLSIRRPLSFQRANVIDGLAPEASELHS